jgi:hypothetical protein
MTDETRQKLEQLAAVECAGCKGQACESCKYTGKRWSLLDTLHIGFDSGAEVLYAIEQCLGMLGRLTFTDYQYDGPFGPRYAYSLERPDPGSSEYLPSDEIADNDRLTAAVECLWEAADGQLG